MRLTIIGGGPAGYTAAFAAAEKGIAVTLVENEKIGGTCLNHGCIPTKTMAASAYAINLARRMREFGVDGCDAAAINPLAVQKRRETVINTLVGGLQKTCQNLGINYITGTARPLDAGHVAVVTQSGEEIIEGDNIILATGSRISQLPGLEFDHTVILDSNDALELETIPANLLIVGGGVIGCELACIYKSFGSNVTVVEGQNRLLPMPGIDLDISSLLSREMRRRKIKIITGATLKDVAIADNQAHGMLCASPFVAPEAALAKETPISADAVFVTVGRAPAADGLALDHCGVAQDKRGWVIVDDRLQTSVPGIYAAGDLLGPAHVMLAHVAAMEGQTIVNGLLGASGIMDYSAVPAAIFTEPEIATVGLSETAAKEKFANVVSGVVQTRALGKAQAMGELPGFFKIIANGDNGQVLGVQLAGAHASDMIAEGTLAVRGLIDLEAIASTIHAHPTLAEGMFEAAAQALKNRK